MGPLVMHIYDRQLQFFLHAASIFFYIHEGAKSPMHVKYTCGVRMRTCRRRT